MSILRKISVSIVLGLLASINTLAQKPKVEFGKVDIEELKKAKYEIDTTAEAIVLYEKADTEINYEISRGFYHETTIFIRKKILKASALSMGTVEIPYVRGNNDNSQSLTDIMAASYTIENGSMIKSELTRKEIYDEKSSDRYSKKKFTIPNVKEGCILEYSYTVFTPLNVSDKPNTWYFQSSSPTLWSEYEFSVPDWIYYQVIMGGYLPMAHNSNERVNITSGYSKFTGLGTKYTFAVKDAPAFKNESFITTSSDYVSKVEFELSSVSIPGEMIKNYSTSYTDINKTLTESDNFGQKLRKTNYLKETIAKFNAITDKKEKLEKVYYYMNHYMDLDENYGRVFVSDLKKAFENKKGTPSEQNLIFTAMLREMDYEANPVILSTRDNGKINENFALLDRFNYTVCRVKVDTTYYLLDISDKHLKMGMLPDICLNGKGREINKTGGEFVTIKPTEKYRTYKKVDAKLDLKTGKMVAKYEESPNGYLAYDYKKTYTKIGKEKFIENEKKKVDEITVGTVNLKNFEEKDLQIGIEYDFTLNEEFSGDEDILYINPMMQGKVDENPFKLEERLYPVDFGAATDLSYVFNLDVPAGYIVESLPKPVSMTMPDKTGQFSYNCTHDAANNKISVISRVNLKNVKYYTTQYAELKELYNRIVQKHNEQIVLKKK